MNSTNVHILQAIHSTWSQREKVAYIVPQYNFQISAYLCMVLTYSCVL